MSPLGSGPRTLPEASPAIVYESPDGARSTHSDEVDDFTDGGVSPTGADDANGVPSFGVRHDEELAP